VSADVLVVRMPDGTEHRYVPEAEVERLQGRVSSDSLIVAIQRAEAERDALYRVVERLSAGAQGIEDCEDPWLCCVHSPEQLEGDAR
jgi:hypothetical protein